MCVSLSEDTQIVRPSVCPLTCLCDRLFAWTIFPFLSVGLSVCLYMSRSIYASFSVCLLNCQSVRVYVFFLTSAAIGDMSVLKIGHDQDRTCPCRSQIP